jgi:hypothetical protein
MKKLMIFLLVISLSSFSNINDQKKSVTDLLCSGKWYTEYATIDKIKRTIPEERKKDTWMIFHKNGKYEASSPGTTHPGTWTLSKDQKIITITENSSNTHNIDDVSNQKIILINSAKMILKSEMLGKKVVIYLKKE